MAEQRRTEDPFARLAGLPTDQRLFAVKRPTGQRPRTQNPPPGVTQKSTPAVTPKPTSPREPSRGNLRENSRYKPRDVSDKPREPSRDKPRDLPTRNEIQEFSFRLRDDLKVKVQAEVPHKWQTELEELARELNVKKLELYRFILGEFLGKVRRKKAG